MPEGIVRVYMDLFGKKLKEVKQANVKIATFGKFCIEDSWIWKWICEGNQTFSDQAWMV